MACETIREYFYKTWSFQRKVTCVGVDIKLNLRTFFPIFQLSMLRLSRMKTTLTAAEASDCCITEEKLKFLPRNDRKKVEKIEKSTAVLNETFS